MNNTTNTPMADNEIAGCDCLPKCTCRPENTAHPIREVLGTFMVFVWIMGFVVAKGFWSTIFCIIPFYAWYLTVERAMTLYLGPSWL